jgi:hypothetical protein
MVSLFLYYIYIFTFRFNILFIEYIALWDYPGSGPDDLAFSQDEVILVRDNNDNEDWWFGTSEVSKKTGYFPRNYVQVKPEGKLTTIKETSNMLSNHFIFSYSRIKY